MIHQIYQRQSDEIGKLKTHSNKCSHFHLVRFCCCCCKRGISVCSVDLHEILTHMNICIILILLYKVLISYSRNRTTRRLSVFCLLLFSHLRICDKQLFSSKIEFIRKYFSTNDELRPDKKTLQSRSCVFVFHRASFRRTKL